MAASERYKTTYPGVFYRKSKRIGGSGEERVYYVLFKKDGKLIEEKVGRQYANDMTPAKANGIRAERIEGKRLSRKEIRENEEAARNRPTIRVLWETYKTRNADKKSLKNDISNYNKYVIIS